MNYLSSPSKDEVATAIALPHTAIERKKAVKAEKKLTNVKVVYLFISNLK